MSEQQQWERVLPADIYDTLEFAALAFGGIGAGSYLTTIDGSLAPVCAIGFGYVLNGGYDDTSDEDVTAISDALRAVGIGESVNDEAVAQINRRRGKLTAIYARVPFKAWAKELNVVRGEA